MALNTHKIAGAQEEKSNEMKGEECFLLPHRPHQVWILNLFLSVEALIN